MPVFIAGLHASCTARGAVGGATAREMTPPHGEGCPRATQRGRRAGGGGRVVCAAREKRTPLPYLVAGRAPCAAVRAFPRAGAIVGWVGGRMGVAPAGVARMRRSKGGGWTR